MAPGSNSAASCATTSARGSAGSLPRALRLRRLPRRRHGTRQDGSGPGAARPRRVERRPSRSHSNGRRWWSCRARWCSTGSEEAARFAPQLRMLDTAAWRAKPGEHFHDYDLVLTTYGTLRRDCAAFQGPPIRLLHSRRSAGDQERRHQSAKAARLLRADHRLALSGTPVENHLGELWSLFEFLNPGMLGSASVFGGRGTQSRQPVTRAILARPCGRSSCGAPRTGRPGVAGKDRADDLLRARGGERKLYDELRALLPSAVLPGRRARRLADR